MSRHARYFCRQTGLRISLFLVFLTGSLCMLAAMQAQVSLLRQRQVSASAQYGSWDALVRDPDPETEQLLRDHVLLESAAKEAVFGEMILDPARNAEVNGTREPESAQGGYQRGAWKKEQCEYLAGYADREFISMTQPPLLAGTWPKHADEAVIETRVADSLGLPAQPGELLTGTLNGRTYTFRITGVLDNYTASWTEGRRQPSIFVGEGFNADAASTFLFIKGKRPGLIQDLGRAVPELVMNEKIQGAGDPFSYGMLPYTVMLALSLGGVVLTEGFVFDRWLKAHARGLVTMRLLGISPRDICRDLALLMLQALGPAILITVSLGIFLQMTGTQLAILAGLLVLSALVILAVCQCLVRRIPVPGSKGRPLGNHLPKKPMKDMRPKSLALRFLSVHRGRLALQLGLLAILSGAFFSLGLSFAQSQASEENMARSHDFLVSAPYGQTIPQSLVRRLLADPKFSQKEQVYADYSQWHVDMTPAQSQALYSQPGWDTAQMPPEKDGVQEVYLPVFASSRLPEWPVEEFDEELWRSGKGVVAVLGCGMTDAEGNRPDPFGVGDTLTLYDPAGEKREVQVAGILRGTIPSSASPFGESLFLPFGSLIAAPGFVNEEITRIWLNLNDPSERLSVQDSLVAACRQAGMDLDNQSGLKQAALTMYEREMTMEAVLAGFVLMLVILACLLSGSSVRGELAAYGRNLVSAGLLPEKEREMERQAAILLGLLLAAVLIVTCLAVLGIHLQQASDPGYIRIQGETVSQLQYLDRNPWLLTRTDQKTAFWLLPGVPGIAHF